jgi:hypothetical protein
MMNETGEHQSRERLDELLLADHAALEETFRRTVARFDGGDPDAAHAGWSVMTDQLEAHLRAEEHFMLPRFEKRYPEEAVQIRREHDQMRASMLQFGIDLDLHSLRAETVAAFIEGLRAHARREEGLFYVWSREGMLPAERQLAVQSLRAAVRRVAADV